MSQKNFSPVFKTFHWLKNEGTIDAKAERCLKFVATKYRRIMVMGNPHAGKNTVANTLFAFMQEKGYEPVFTPTLHAHAPWDFTKDTSWKNCRTWFTQKHPVIVPMGYTQEFYGEQYMPGLFPAARNFDVIVDVRRLPDGQRTVCQILVRKGQTFRCLYRAKNFAGLQIGLAA